MVYFADPAVLGSIIVGAVLSGWLLGRQHGSGPVAGGHAPGAALEAVPEPQAETPPALVTDAITPCQYAARAERRQVIEAARSLGELHAEVTAYRLQEQVLASAASDGLLVELIPADERGDCRYLGLIGQPTCPLPGTGQETCGSREGCAVAARRVDQPVAEPSAFTRV